MKTPPETIREESRPPDGGLCSSCGLCMSSAWPVKESVRSCVFRTGWLGEQERALFGRERASAGSGDEVRFGISIRRLVGCIRKPPPGAAWSGVITRIAQAAFETGMVEAVVTLHRSNDDWFSPVPVLARSTADILAGSGNKPVVSPVLSVLESACRQGIRRLLVIGAACHIHTLRDFKRRFSYLRDMEIYTVGIPCTDNVRPQTLRRILKLISRSPETVRHYEFMQDFNVYLWHVNGGVEKVPYFCLPRELTGSNFVVPACMCCFDYVNSLADITVGYMGAPLYRGKLYQWIIIRSGRGARLYDLVADQIDEIPETTAGSCKKSVRAAAVKLEKQLRAGSSAVLKTGPGMPLWPGRALAAVMKLLGPRGLEYARYGVDMHLIRNYYYVVYNYPGLVEKLVPAHVYGVLDEYGFKP